MKSILFCAIFICLGIVNSYGHIIERSREIELHNAKVDTRSAPLFHNDEAHLARSRLFSEEQEHQYLIHVGKSLTQVEKNALEAYLGFTLENYIPHNTYLVVCDKKTAMDALYAPNVQWVGDFAPEYKIPVHLLEQIVDNKLLVTLSPKERSFSDVQSIASIWRDSMEGVTEVKAVSNSQIGITFEKKQDAERIVNWIAQRPESHFIEAARKYEAYNYYASQVIQSNSNPSVPFPFTNNMGFNGNNDLVGVADSGLKYSSCYFNTSTVSSSTINSNAKVVLYNTTYSGGDMTDATGHGTAVTGTITGINGGDKADGITPNTRIFFMDIQAAASSAPLNPPANLGDLFNPAFQAGANLFVAAFGAPANGYGTDAASIDKYCYTNQQFLPIVPAGNSDSLGANRTLSSLAQSKNALVVGASYTSNEGLYDNAQGASEALKYISSPALYGSHVLSSISSRGPTVDGRIKPDIVAPGQTIITADSTLTCGSKQVTGTSYAAGVATSAAVIVRNYFEQSYYPSGASDPGNAQLQSPSASLVKAVLINSGAALLSTDSNQKGDYIGLGPIPSGYQGYGRIQLDNTLFTNAVKRDPNQNFYAYAGLAESLSTGNSIRYCFAPSGTPSTIKATLVWADKDASPAAGHVLVNDLDLVGMDLSGIIYRSQTANGGFDTFNNVEQVEVSGLGPTAFHVHARSVPVGPQSYAVVFSGTNFQSTYCPTDFDPGNRVCPGQCSGVGNCTDQGYCACPPGRQGLDCSLSPCPTVGGYICAGNGYCDYSTSTCVCGGLYAQPDCASLQPQAPPTNTNSTTFIVAPNETGISAGLLAGTVIAAFFVGAIFSIFLGGYIAVRYLEYRRDKIQKDRATKDEEMH